MKTTKWMLVAAMLVGGFQFAAPQTAEAQWRAGRPGIFARLMEMERAKNARLRAMFGR